MFILKRHAMVAALFGALLSAQFDAQAEHVKVVSGMVGAQDSKSKELLALPPAAANQVATRDLLSVLKPKGTFTRDNSNNVEAMTFVTQPYQTGYRYVCREDRVTLQYQYEDRFDTAGTWLDDPRRAVGVDAQQVYHIEQLPVPGFIPGASYRATVCDERQPGAAATWFAAPSAIDAIRAANMFRMAEDEVRAGQLTPGPCDPHGTDTCRRWVLSLDDPSRIKSVEQCAMKDDNACYVISFGDIDVTVAGTIPGGDSEPITPTAISSIRVDAVMTFSD